MEAMLVIPDVRGNHLPGARRLKPASYSAFSDPSEFGNALGVKRLHSFAEVVRLAQAAVAVTFELDRDRERRILGVVQKLLCCALGERRECAQLLDQGVGRALQLAVRHTFRCEAPIVSLPRGNTPRAHDDVFGPSYANDLLQPRRPA